ncbi:unnamed protein product, partial [Porites evermanni]
FFVEKLSLKRFGRAVTFKRNMSNSQRLAFAIIEHLSAQLKSGAVVGDSAESLEVSIQCLESVYGIDRGDSSQVEKLKFDKPLEEIFESAVKSIGGSTSAQSTEENRLKAENLKTEGNQLMKEEKYEEAIKCYTKAMELDSANAVFPCNRAAAHSKKGDHQKAIEDCQKALTLDPNYGKAYGRMGLSYHNLNNLQKAKECYTKALELEPGSTFYQTSLSQVEEKIKQTQPGGGARPAPGGRLWKNGLINSMAKTTFVLYFLVRMTSMMGGGTSPGGAGGAASIFQAAQQFGEQMQQSNPEMFEQLRTQAQAAVNMHREQQDQSENDDSKPGQ